MDRYAGLPQAAGSLADQLAVEAGARSQDADTIGFEKLAKALEPAGITFGPTRQLMGRTQLAIYCVRADGTGDVEVTVCEYPNAAAAAAGEKESNVVFDKIAGHSSRAHKKSVLHVVKKSTTPEETVAKIYAAFDAL